MDLHPIAASRALDCRVYRISLDQSAGDANIEQRPLSISPNETLWNVGRGPPLLRLDVGRSDHLAPLLDLFGDELGEVGGRARKRSATQIGKPRLRFGVGEGRVELLIELIYELRRRILGRTKATPRA